MHVPELTQAPDPNPNTPKLKCLSGVCDSHIHLLPNDGVLIDLLLGWAPDMSTRNRILVDNPCTLYDFPMP